MSRAVERFTQPQLDILRRWVVRLRSGEVKQCRRRLLDEEERCCIGVLAELIGYKGDTARQTNYMYKNDYFIKGRIDSGLLREATGLDDDIDQQYFIDMNDIDMANFLEIADEVEKRFPQLKDLSAKVE